MIPDTIVKVKNTEEIFKNSLLYHTRDKEIYKACTYPNVKKGKYLIGNYGSVLFIPRTKVIRTFIGEDGYEKVYLTPNKYDNTNSSIFNIHELVAWEWKEETRNNNKKIIHIDNDKLNNYYENLASE